MDKPLQAAYSIEEAAQIAAAHPDVLYYVRTVQRLFIYGIHFINLLIVNFSEVKLKNIKKTIVKQEFGMKALSV